ncbi:hypothetical protein PR048_025731 [Dryococelus australis]|uniref:RsbT co-antagonist protein RsbRD N-terminal domain-containing protein n=1 Tax=Dryococelus australis TaxID=614101 RepID=A0ABQ9GJD1_9NEOP|nr:hypothetical protein PR048_025731 [Dryococelus australis]
MALPIKEVRTLDEWLKIIEEVERNACKKHVHAVRHLSLPLGRSIQTVDALCEATQAAENSSEDEKEDASAEQAEKIITFYEAYSALETIKPFFHTRNTSEHDQDTLLRMEAMLLHSRIDAKQTIVKDFF